MANQRHVDGVGGIGDAGITAGALPERTATVLDEAGLPTVAAEAAPRPGRILDVGRAAQLAARQPEDDYGARFEAFTESISGQSDAFQDHLMAALLEQTLARPSHG